MAQFICRDVSLGYDGKVIAEHISFEINSGDYLCIVGENGSGKSTLVRAMLKLHEPMSGEITTGDGVLPTDIGYLPQQTEVQRDFPASVREIVLSGFTGHLGAKPFYSREQKVAAMRAMERLGIDSLARHCYRELSGGQQQRVLLARALCATKKILLLDEPAAGLDPKVTGEMYSLIENLNREDGITIIMVSHDIAAAIRYATHILHIGHKRNFFGTKEEYIKSEDGRAFISLSGEDVIRT
ncbi:MAG: ABC transporter ATP-binding protein [Clostridiales bacterium]|nr:ABC transporter ATP-binding protein [Clostridiales bacterium]